MIIGDLPHNFESNKFHKSQLLSTYSYDRESLNSWGLEFDNIYHYNKKNKTIKDFYNSVYIDFNNYLIQTPRTYYNQMREEFFKEYISKKICISYRGDGFESIYCNKSENFTINDLQQFPKLYLQNNELQYIFEFNYEDFFIEKDNKYWFLVILPIYYDLEEWYFGIIFLRKYNLIFNPDSKTISFYNPNLPYEEDGNSPKEINDINIKLIVIIVIIILLGIIFIGLGIYIGKIIYDNKKEKKRFNELDDNFEYISQEFN